MAPHPAIPLLLQDDPHQPPIEIDGARVARGLGLDAVAFRQRMAERKVGVLCERGTGDDAGRWRATFYYEGRRVRLVVDEAGKVLGEG